MSIELINAAEEGNIEEVQRLLKKGVDMEFKDEEGWTALHISVVNTNFDIMKILLDTGADKDARDNSGHTPLHYAALEGRGQVVEQLLAAGADTEARMNAGVTPLHLAALKGHEQVVERLLSADADKDARDNTECTPLHLAALKGHEQVVERLLSADADKDARDNQEWTPLHYAALNGRKQVVERLLASGADTEARDNQECTPLHHAAQKGHEQVVERLLVASADTEARMNDGATLLHLAAQKGHEKVVELLLAAGADKDTRTNTEITPLYIASMNGYEQVVERLLAAGADTEARDNQELTPLHHAAQKGHEQVVERLLAAGADTEARDNRKVTPLHMAAEKGYDRVIERLLAAGADKEARINSGHNPLHLATQNGHEQVVERLLAAGADTEARDNQEWTPLHLAALTGHDKVIERLLAAGADTEARINSGYNPLHLAALTGHDKVIERLLAAGADTEAREEDNWTPLHLAAQNGHDKVIERLLAADVDKEARTNTEKTPLHLAAQNGHDKVIERLLAADVDKEARTNTEKTPLHLAALTGHEQVVERLLAAGADTEAREEDNWTPLHLAALTGHEQVVERLLAAGVNADALSNVGETPIYMAVSKDRVNVVKILLDTGVDRELQHQTNGTPLHSATANSNVKMVSLLLDNGADVEALRSFDGMSALRLAAINGYKGIVELLLDHGAKIDAMDQLGRTALYFTLREGWDDISDLLLAGDAKIDDLDGRGLIHVAASEGDIKVIKKLLIHITNKAKNSDGDDTQIKSELSLIDSDGNTALHIAASAGHKNIVKFLLKNGLDASIVNKSGLTAFKIAAQALDEAMANIGDENTEREGPDSRTMEDIVLLFNLTAEIKEKHSTDNGMQALYLSIIYDENIKVSSIEELESKYLKIFKLKETYRADDKLPKLIDDEAIKEQSLEDYYVKLQIILRDSAKQQGVAGRTELVSGEKKPIEMADIFSKLDSEYPESTRVLMLGGAGVGKSTLMHYISYRWGRGNLWNDRYDYVVRLKLRELLNNDWVNEYDGNERRSVPLACFAHYCLGEDSDKFSLEDISYILESDKLLLLVDGYDEVAGLVKRGMSKKIFDAAMGHQHIILASRPNAVRDDLKKEFDRVIENIGLDDYGIEQYIDNAFAFTNSVEGEVAVDLSRSGSNRESIVATDTNQITRQNLASELKAFLLHNYTIRGICTVPINTALICLIWEDAKDKFGEDFSISTLYQEVVIWLGKRYLTKFDPDYDDREIDEINDENVITSAAIRAFKEIAQRGFTENGGLIMRGTLIDKFISVVRQSGAADLDLYRIHQYGLLKAERAQKNLLNNDFAFIHLTFQEYLMALKFRELLQDNAVLRTAEGEEQTIGEFIAHHRDEPRYLMSLKFLVSLVEKARIDTNHSDYCNAKIIEETQSLVTRFWEAMSCNIDGVIDLDVKEKVKLLLHLLGQVKDLSDLEEATEDQDGQSLAKIKIPNLQEMIEFVDSELLRDIDYWGQEIIASEYRSSSIVRFFDTKPDITSGDSSDLDSFVSKIDLIASSRYSVDKLEVIISNLISQFEQTKESIAKKLILESLVKLANKDLSHELKEVMLAKYLDILMAIASEDRSTEAFKLQDTAEQNIGELAVKLQLGGVLLGRLADLITATNISGSDIHTETQLKNQKVDDKKYIIKVITEIAKDQHKLTKSAYKHLAEMIKSDDLSIRSDLALAIAELVTIDPNLAEKGFKTLLISLKHSQDTDDIDNLSAAICSTLKINPKLILSELANITAMLDAEEFQTRQVGISLLTKYVEIDNAIIPLIYSKLQNLLTDSDWQIKKASIEALGKFAEHSIDAHIVRDIYQSLLPMLEHASSNVKSATIKSLGSCVSGDYTLATEVQEKIMPLFHRNEIEVMKSLEQCMKFDQTLVDVVYGKVIIELSYANTDIDRWQAIFSALEVCIKIKPELKSDLYSRLQSRLDSEENENIYMDSVLAECLKSDAIDVKSILNKLYIPDRDKAAVVKTVMTLLDKINVENVLLYTHQLQKEDDRSGTVSQEKILSLYRIFDYKKEILKFVRYGGNEDAKKIFGKLSATLKDHMPDISDRELFIEFMVSIDQKFDSLCNEGTKKLFKIIYTKLLEFESQESASLSAVGKSLIGKFLQSGFTTSFDLNKCELIYEGRHYKIINDRNLLEEELCESAVTAANKSGNPLARQIVDHIPLFVNSSDGDKISAIKEASYDARHSVGVLSGLSGGDKEELDYASYDVSLCARSNHNGELKDSFILLEQRLVTGEYLYRKIYTENGKVKIVSGSVNPIDMIGISSTNVRKAIFGEMSYYGDSEIAASSDEAIVERPVYHTKTLRVRDENAVIAMYQRLEGSVVLDDEDGVFGLLVENLNKLLDSMNSQLASDSENVIGTWEEFRIGSNSFDKSIVLNLSGAELDKFKSDEAYFADHVKLDNLDREFRETILADAEILQSVIHSERLKLRDKREIDQISKDSYQDAFYKSLRMEINSSYLAATTIKSGWVKSDKKGDMGKFGSFMKEVSGVVPFVGPGVSILGSVLKMADSKHQKAMIENYASFVVDSTEMAEIAELISRRVTLSKLAIKQKDQSMKSKIKGWIANAADKFNSDDLSLLPEDIDEAVSMVQNRVMDTVQDKISEATDVQGQAEEYLSSRKEELMDKAANKLAGINSSGKEIKKAKSDAKIVAQMIAGKIFSGEFKAGDIKSKADAISEFIGSEFSSLEFDASIDIAAASENSTSSILVLSNSDEQEGKKVLKTTTPKVIKGTSLDNLLSSSPRLSATQEEITKDISLAALKRLKILIDADDIESAKPSREEAFVSDLAQSLASDHSELLEKVESDLRVRSKLIKKIASKLEESGIGSVVGDKFVLSNQFTREDDFFESLLSEDIGDSSVIQVYNIVAAADREVVSPEAAGACCIVSHAKIIYDNVILNEKELLETAVTRYGSKIVNQLIEFGSDSEAAEELIAGVQAYGARQVLGIIFGEPDADMLEQDAASQLLVGSCSAVDSVELTG